MNTKKFGDSGEAFAAEYLAGKGFSILERNYRTPMGEIDLIARDGRVLVFIEVKTRKTERYGRPALAVGLENSGASFARLYGIRASGRENFRPAALTLWRYMRRRAAHGASGIWKEPSRRTECRRERFVRKNVRSGDARGERRAD